MARGNNKMAIFLDDLDYARFLEMFTDVIATYEIDSWTYCLMPNHYHLVLRTRRPNLSRAMGHLNGRFFQWWNKRHKRVGHVLQGRFKGQVVETSVYLLRLCRYVLLNPVRGGLCAHPRDWPWSSYGALVSDQPSPLVDVESLVRQIHPESNSVLPRLITYIGPAADPEIAAFIRGDRRVIGTPAFEEQFRAEARAASREVPAKERRTGTPSLVEILTRSVQNGEGIGAGVRRARQTGGYTLAEIARCAGLSEGVVTRMAIGLRRGVGRLAPKTRDSRPDPARRRNGDLTPGDAGSET
jgi:REP-associated tyrosine transposase